MAETDDHTPKEEYNEEEWEELSWKASKVFTPAVPVSENDLFAGRSGEINKVIDAINQVGQHAVIYGERGVGKTSLANVLSSRLVSRAKGLAISPKVNCDTTDTFSGLWKKVLSRIKMVVLEQPVGFQKETRERVQSALDLLSSESEITPDLVRIVLSAIGKDQPLLVIIDEFDRLPEDDDRRTIADTIKTLSDYAVPATLVIVGVAETVSELIAEHESIERALSQIPMPRMEPSELHEILDKGTRKLGMTIDTDARSKIAVLSQGFPSYTHRLGLYAARIALGHSRLRIENCDVNPAIEEAVTDAQQGLKNNYRKAVASPQKNNLYERVLLACALAKNDQFGYFKAADVKKPMLEIMEKPYEIPSFARHLSAFCDSSRGCVLKKEGVKRKHIYRFNNALMQPFVVMKGIVDKRIDEDEWFSNLLLSSNEHLRPS